MKIRYNGFLFNILQKNSWIKDSAYRADRPADQTGWSLCLSFFLQLAEKLIILFVWIFPPCDLKKLQHTTVKILDLKLLNWPLHPCWLLVLPYRRAHFCSMLLFAPWMITWKTSRRAYYCTWILTSTQIMINKGMFNKGKYWIFRKNKGVSVWPLVSTLVCLSGQFFYLPLSPFSLTLSFYLNELTR